MQISVNEDIEEIRSTLSLAKKLSNDIAIIIVANIKSNDLDNDFQTHSLKTEFLAESEYEGLLNGFRENGFYVLFHNNEMNFFRWYLNGGIKEIQKKYIAVFNSASGGKGPGRKALVPAFCNLNNIPITSSNPYVVSLCRHKYHFTSLLQNHGLPAIPSWYYSKSHQWLLGKKPSNGKKVIVKPTYESASIGIDSSSIFEYTESLDEKLMLLSESFDQPMTIQELISGYEVEVPILMKNENPIAIGVIGLELENTKLLNEQILTYDIVYDDGYNFYSFNELGNEFNTHLLDTAKKAALVIGIEGFGRIDFRVTTDKVPFIMDVSTYPHITHHSSFWYMFNELNLSYSDLLGVLVGLTGIKYSWR